MIDCLSSVDAQHRCHPEWLRARSPVIPVLGQALSVSVDRCTLTCGIPGSGDVRGNVAPYFHHSAGTRLLDTRTCQGQISRLEPPRIDDDIDRGPLGQRPHRIHGNTAQLRYLDSVFEASDQRFLDGILGQEPRAQRPRKSLTQGRLTRTGKPIHQDQRSVHTSIMTGRPAPRAMHSCAACCAIRNSHGPPEDQRPVDPVGSQRICVLMLGNGRRLCWLLAASRNATREANGARRMCRAPLLFASYRSNYALPQDSSR